MSRFIKRAQQKAQGLLKKGAEKVNECKKGLAVAGATVVTTASQAAVTYDAATQKLSGNVEMGAYESAIPIVLAVMGVTITVGFMFGLFSRAKRG